MRTRAVLIAAVLAGSSFALYPEPPASAAPTIGDREWNELYPTTGLTWSQVASVCPTDGSTPCAGTVGGKNLSGWVWATAPQVLELFERYAPGISTREPAVDNTFFAGVAFLNEFRWTTYTASTYFSSEYAGGWTASLDSTGVPIAAGGSYETPFFAGGIGLGATPDAASNVRGVFLWRPAGLDYTPPVVSAQLSGTLGSNGWYRSDVGVSWSVVDAESPIATTTGCGPSTVATDTAGVTLTCTATSTGAGGPGSATVTVKRDATAPTVVCGAAPTYTLTQAGATVSATVSDAMSGTAAASVTVAVSTAVAGPRTAVVSVADRAGNVGSASCPYVVVVPTCKGKVATIVGTGAGDVLTGTTGADVILGLAGNDTIDGKGGNDTICGGDGADLVYGGAGADLVDGGAGGDDLQGGAQADDLDGGADSDSIRGGDGADRCTSGEIRMSSCAVLY